MMGAIASVDGREDLGLGIIDRQLTPRSVHRESYCRCMLRSLLAEGGLVLRRPHAGGKPDAAFLVEHGIVDGGLAVPDDFASPIGRSIRNVIVLARRRV